MPLVTTIQSCPKVHDNDELRIAASLERCASIARMAKI